MGLPCDSCGSSSWTYKKTWIDGATSYCRCSECDKDLRVGLPPSVAFTPANDGCEYNPNIADANGDAIPLTSRAHKAEMMKRFNLREAGDRVHGARNFDPISYRHGMESLRSADNRRKHG